MFLRLTFMIFMIEVFHIIQNGFLLLKDAQAYFKYQVNFPCHLIPNHSKRCTA